MTLDKRMYKAGEKSRRKTRGGKKCPEEEEPAKERQRSVGRIPQGGVVMESGQGGRVVRDDGCCGGRAGDV